MLHSYRFGGMDIASTFAVVGLRSAAQTRASAHGNLKLCTDTGTAPLADRIVFAWPGRYATRLGTIGDDWLIDSALDGVFRLDRALTRIHIHSKGQDGVPSASAVDILVRRLLPRILAARGALSIHAAAAATSDGGVLLLGRSGAGKSTVTAALAATAGWDVFSDDLSIVPDGDSATVAPSATGVCVWEASRDGLGLDPAACRAMPGYDRKYRFEPPGQTRTEAAPLRALVFLARDPDCDRPELIPMKRADALVHAAQQVILFNPADAHAEQAAAIGRLARILAGARTVRLRYPARFDALPDVARALEGLLAA